LKKNRTIFLIDDDVDDQEVFAMALAEIDESIFCVTAKNGLEALEKLKTSEFRPDYIFLDLNMPRMNGKQFLKEWSRSAASDIPVVIYSTSAEDRDVEETKALGAVAFITKPPRMNDLVTSLHKVLTP
jgi:CheY-like chemotaxis protein